MKFNKAIFLISCLVNLANIKAVTFSEFLEAQEKGPYYYDHQKRYVETSKFMESWIDFSNLDGKRVLELGGRSPILSYLESRGVIAEEYTEELRNEISLPQETFDVVLLLEVFEHLKDIESQSHNATQCFTGPKHLIKEIQKLLKPGGVMILTTPNASSLNVFYNFLMKRTPYNYNLHPREYTKAEVIDLVLKGNVEYKNYQDTGELVDLGRFELINSQIIDVWNLPPEANREKLIEAIHACGADTTERGDDMMFIFRKN